MCIRDSLSSCCQRRDVLYVGRCVHTLVFRKCLLHELPAEDTITAPRKVAALVKTARTFVVTWYLITELNQVAKTFCGLTLLWKAAAFCWVSNRQLTEDELVAYSTVCERSWKRKSLLQKFGQLFSIKSVLQSTSSQRTSFLQWIKPHPPYPLNLNDFYCFRSRDLNGLSTFKIHSVFSKEILFVSSTAKTKIPRNFHTNVASRPTPWYQKLSSKSNNYNDQRVLLVCKVFLRGNKFLRKSDFVLWTSSSVRRKVSSCYQVEYFSSGGISKVTSGTWKYCLGLYRTFLLFVSEGTFERHSPVPGECSAQPISDVRLRGFCRQAVVSNREERRQNGSCWWVIWWTKIVLKSLMPEMADLILNRTQKTHGPD